MVLRDTPALLGERDNGGRKGRGDKREKTGELTAQYEEPHLPRRHLQATTDLEDGVDALSPGVAHSAEPVARHRASHHARHVGDDEAEGAAAHAAEHAPKGIRGTGRAVAPFLRHALLAEHLLEDVAELLILGLPARLFVGRPPVGEEGPGPRVCLAGAGSRAGPAGRGGNIFVGFLEWVRRRCGAATAAAAAAAARGAGAVDLALRVVLAAAGRVGEGVVGVVDELELASAGGAVWGVRGDPVGVRLQGGSAEEEMASVMVSSDNRTTGQRG